MFFDDAYAQEGHGSDPDTYYSPFGVNFDNTNGFGVIDGEAKGDSGNWDIEGTYGPQGLGDLGRHPLDHLYLDGDNGQPGHASGAQ